MKRSKVNGLSTAGYIKPTYWLVLCAAPLMLGAAKDSKESQPELTLELLEFLADYSDDKGQLVDPETLDPIVKTGTRKQQPCITHSAPIRALENTTDQASSESRQPQLHGNVIDKKPTKECETSETDPKLKLDKENQPTQIEETNSDV